MDMWNYIKFGRAEEEAYLSGPPKPEEAIYESYEIDEHDTKNDLSTYHVIKLEKQKRRQKRKILYYLQLLSVAVCALLLICLSVLFFVFDHNITTGFPEKTVYAENYSNHSLTLDYSMNDLAVIEPPQKAEIPVVHVQREKKKKAEKGRSINRYQMLYEPDDYYESDDYTLSRDEIQKILSNYSYDYDDYDYKHGSYDYNYSDTRVKVTNNYSDTRVKATNNYSDTRVKVTNNNSDTKVKVTNDQTPKPTIGDKAYNDYIKKNRSLLADGAGEKRHGKVILLFNVNENGRPVDISILRPLCQAADQEAVRLLKNGPNWTVGKKNAYLDIDF